MYVFGVKQPRPRNLNNIPTGVVLALVGIILGVEVAIIIGLI